MSSVRRIIAFGGAVGGDGFDRIRQIDGFPLKIFSPEKFLMASLDNRTLGFEDLPNLGNQDFDDIVITIDNFSVSV